MKFHTKLPYSSGFWVDMDVLFSKLSKSFFQKLTRKLHLVTNPKDTAEITKYLSQFADECIEHQDEVSYSDLVCYLRAVSRITGSFNIPEWIRNLKFNDPALIVFKIVNDPNLTLHEITEEIHPFIKKIDYSVDPEKEALRIAINATLLFNMFQMNNSEEIDKLVIESRKIFLDNKKDPLLVWLYCGMIIGYGFYLWGNREIERAKKIYEEVEDIVPLIKTNSIKANLANGKGILYSLMGDAEKAIEQLDIVRDINRESGFIRGEVIALTNSVDCFIQTGNFQKAIENLEQARSLNDALVKENNLVDNVQAIILNNLSETYHYKKDFPEALSYAKDALALIDQSQKRAYVYIEIQKTYLNALIDMQEYAEVKTQLKEIENTLAEQFLDSIAIGYHYFSGRLSSALGESQKAHESFMKSLEFANKCQSFNLQIQIQLQLAQMYIMEFSSSQNQHILPNVLQFIENIIRAAKDQEFSYLLCKGLLMKANIEQIQENFSEAILTLHEAKKIAINLPQELKTIEEKLEEIKNEESGGDNGSQQNILMNSLNQLSNSFIRAKTLETKPIHYNIYAILVLDKSGMPIYSHYNDKELDSKNILISGLISAINAFSANLMRESNKGALKSIRHENMEILLEEQNEQLIALISDKDTFELRNKMLQLCHSIPSIKPMDEINQPYIHQEELDALFAQIFA